MMGTNYLDNLEIHQFEESMTLTECGFETMAMANHEWEAIEESIDLNGMSLFEAELLGLEEAGGNFFDKIKELGKKIIELLKKIASYIMGVISKWIIALMKLVNKDAFKAKDKARILRGAEKLTKEGKEVKIYGLLVSKNTMPDYDKFAANIGTSAGDISLKDAREFAKTATANEDISEYLAKEQQFYNDARGYLAGGNSIDAKDFRTAIRVFMTDHKDVSEYTFNSSNLPGAAITAQTTINKGADKQKQAAKKSYDKINKAINGMIEKVKKVTVSAKDIKDDTTREIAVKYLGAIGKIYKGYGGILSAANSECMNVLAADYRMNAQLLLKCYNAGGSDKKAKEEMKKEKEKSTNESVESIFGIDLI